MRGQRFQKRIAAGRFTLLTVILISVVCWTLSAILLPKLEVQESHYSLWQMFYSWCASTWGSHILSFILYATIGYLLIELNNRFTIIRLRASMQTAIYMMLVSVCPSIQVLYAGNLAAMAFLIAFFFFFNSYQQHRPSGHLFYTFMFLGIGSLFFPQLTLFIPIFWIGAYSFQSLCLKSFFASLIGWSIPYWVFFGYTYLSGQMELFYQPFLELANFQPVRFDFQPWQVATLSYLFLLYIVSSSHCLVAGYEDKIRTRSYLHFLILLNLCIFIYIVLQPALFLNLLSLLLIGTSILIGHLFALTNSRSSNMFFIIMLIGLFTLFGFNLWTLL